MRGRQEKEGAPGERMSSVRREYIGQNSEESEAGVSLPWGRDGMGKGQRGGVGVARIRWEEDRSSQSHEKPAGGQWFRVDVAQGRVGEWTDLTFGCRKVGPRTGVVWWAPRWCGLERAGKGGQGLCSPGSGAVSRTYQVAHRGPGSTPASVPGSDPGTKEGVRAKLLRPK